MASYEDKGHIETIETEHSDIERVDTHATTASSKENNARIDALTPEQKRKIIWRIDRRLVTTLGALYCVSLMDRTNTGITYVAGMGVDLNLIGYRYSEIVLVFFVTYVLLQPPATVVMRKIGPRLFLPTITLLWGIVMIGMGFVKTWTAMLGMRMILGIFEAGFFPSCAYLLRYNHASCCREDSY
jgi:sugar phosphate permease